MKRLLPVLALAPLVSGCIGAGFSAHRTSALDGYFESYNTQNTALLQTPHEGVSTLTGEEYTLWLFPGMFGIGQSTMSGSSTATFNNGGTHTVDVRTEDLLIQSGYPINAQGSVADAIASQRFTVNAHLDVHWRKTSVMLTQVNGGATAGATETRRYTGDAMGIRPGVSANVILGSFGSIGVRGRAFVGYDVPVFQNETLSRLYVNYLAREYVNGSETLDESKGIKANLNGFTGSAGLILTFDCGCF
ncbi:MAG: hypothetical protein IAE99_00135 [Rhodothermales bacterium]|nr:hypothetical protein [Rhodothermales bacterium]MCA0268213.1 hypothetical protein [Bacteroidota bacterium]